MREKKKNEKFLMNFISFSPYQITVKPNEEKKIIEVEYTVL